MSICFINRIYWDRDKISMITDQIDAVSHQHWAMQLFLSIEEQLEISVGEEQVLCKCIVVNRNIPHSFSTNNTVHFSMIIEPTASIAEQLDEIMEGKEYHIFENEDIAPLKKALLQFVHRDELKDYQNFMTQWLTLEGVIIDAKYLEAVKSKYSHVQGEFIRFAIATKDFQKLSVDWDENNTYIQSAAVVADLGVFASPDEFFENHTQHWSKLKNAMYIHFGRKIMNYNVNKMRKAYGK